MKKLRAKHIILPIVALGLIGVYAFYDGIQKSKFNSDLWIAAVSNDIEETRLSMLTPLMAHVLKVGMSMEDVTALLGPPSEERRGGDNTVIGAPQVQLVYQVQRENASTKFLVLGFSHKLKLTDFYIQGEVRALIF